MKILLLPSTLLILTCLIKGGLPAEAGHGDVTNNVTHHPPADSEHTAAPGHHGDQDAHQNDTGHQGNESGHHGNDSGHHDEHEPHGVHLASWNLEYVSQPLVITLFMIVVAMCKLGFHHANVLSSIIPESCLLIILGTVVGAIIHFSGADKTAYLNFSSELFFLYLLPPIILEASYSLNDRVFFDNLGTILLYAVVGTIMNCFIISPLLYGLAIGGAMGTIELTLIQCFVFGALIVAVDPVAVLAIFQEIGVNNVLYFLVFGESLLNDAVTVVLYNMMRAFNKMENIPPEQMLLGIAAFFTVSLGGLCVGILFGVFTALLTRFTTHVRVVEPLALFSLAYAAYLFAELFHFSGIISIIGCGLMQAQYAFHNISHKSLTTVTYFSKVLSATCDSVIFMFLGLSLVRDDHVWHTGFVLWTVFLTLLIRTGVVYLLTFIANRVNRVRKIDWEEQFIMAYGGLRGAVAFCLVAMLDPKTLPPQSMFETTTLAVIIFTGFVQGISIKPLVKLLRIQRTEEKEISIYEEINCHMTDHVMAGVETVVGYYGRNVMRETLDRFDDRYLKHWLQKDPTSKDDQIMELYQKMALQAYVEDNSVGVDYVDFEMNIVPVCGTMHVENVAGSDNLAMMQFIGSDMNLYKPNFMDDPMQALSFEDLPTYPDIAHAAIHDASNRRSTIIAGLQRRSMVASDPGAASPPESPSAEPSSAAQRWRMGLYANLMRKKRGASPVSAKSGESGEEKLSPTPKKRSLFDVLRSKEPPNVVKADPTVADVRRWLVKNPTRQGFHRKYDRNITRDGDSDLVHHLHEKQRRNMRRRMSMGVYSPAGSSAGTPWGSTEVLPAITKNLDVIKEGVPMGRSPHKPRKSVPGHTRVPPPYRHYSLFPMGPGFGFDPPVGMRKMSTEHAAAPTPPSSDEEGRRYKPRYRKLAQALTVDETAEISARDPSKVKARPKSEGAALQTAVDPDLIKTRASDDDVFHECDESGPETPLLRAASKVHGASPPSSSSAASPREKSIPESDAGETPAESPLGGATAQSQSPPTRGADGETPLAPTADEMTTENETPISAAAPPRGGNSAPSQESLDPNANVTDSAKGDPPDPPTSGDVVVADPPVAVLGSGAPGGSQSVKGRGHLSRQLARASVDGAGQAEDESVV